jgi:hypothetical protein
MSLVVLVVLPVPMELTGQQPQELKHQQLLEPMVQLQRDQMGKQVVVVV